MFRPRPLAATIYMNGAEGHIPRACHRETRTFLEAEHMARSENRKKVAAKAASDDMLTAEQLGWRFALGTVLIVGSYAAWPLIPFVIAADLTPSVKAALSGLFGATPFLAKVVAIALMGRPAYQFLKRTVFKRFGAKVLDKRLDAKRAAKQPEA